MKIMFLATISHHGDSRENVHIPVKVWQFYKLWNWDTKNIRVTIHDSEGNMIAENLEVSAKYPVRGAGRIVFFTYYGADELHQYRGVLVEVTIEKNSSDST